MLVPSFFTYASVRPYLSTWSRDWIGLDGDVPGAGWITRWRASSWPAGVALGSSVSRASSGRGGRAPVPQDDRVAVKERARRLPGDRPSRRHAASARRATKARIRSDMARSRVAPKLDNAKMAERLEAFAALLDLAGASYYTARAYRRAAELIRSTPAPVAELVRRGPRAGATRDRARDRATAAGTRRDRANRGAGRARARGAAADRGAGAVSRAVGEAFCRLTKALGVATPEEFRRPRGLGGCGRYRGSGRSAEAAILAALEREERPRPRGAGCS